MIDADKELQEAMPNTYNDLLHNQQPLDGDFARVLYENLWDLYESDGKE